MKNIHIFRTRLSPKVTPCGVVDCGSRQTPVKRFRKGLFHIIEIVIIALVMFIVIFQLSSMSITEPDWGKSRLTIQGRDILYSIGESGINWSDEEGVADFVRYAFNNTHVRHRLELSGAPKKSISVGCLCNGSADCRNFCSWLTGALPGTLSFNGMDTHFTVTETSSINNIFDIMVSIQPLTGMDGMIVNYFSADKGFILVRNLVDQDFTDYGTILNYYFAVDSHTVSGSGNVSFDLAELMGTHYYYRVPRYFSHIPNGTGYKYSTMHTFGEFSSDAVQKMPDPQGMTIAKTENGRPACIANYGVSRGLGRTAWLSRESPAQNDWKTLLTSLILWSSKHTRPITGDDMNIERAVVSMYTVPGEIYRSDYMFQPLKAVLTLGYLY
jgi:hypothetical protein